MSQLISTFSDLSSFNLIDWNIYSLDAVSAFAIGRNLVQPQLTMILTKLHQSQSEIFISDIELKTPTMLIYRGQFIRNMKSHLEWISKFSVFEDYCKLEIYRIDNEGREILINELKQNLKDHKMSSNLSRYSSIRGNNL